MINQNNKRILVWTLSEMKERNGGPSSYLYNLSRQLNNDTFPIDYLPDLLNKRAEKSSTDKTLFHRVKSFLKSLIPPGFKEKIRVKRSFELAISNYSANPYGLEVVNLSDYAAIHFHSTLELVKVIPYLEEFAGKIILTPHTPCPPYEHELNHLKLNLSNLSDEQYNRIVKYDLSAFLRCDYLLLPSIYAIAAYAEGYNRITDFNSLIQSKSIVEIPTGVPQSTFQKNREQIRKELNIPADALVIHYGGRHNQEKGYDLLVQVGNKLVKNNSKFFFLITGNINPDIPHPIHPQWIEIGWTTDPFSYANASDIFVLPNRVSYFDLILIEMLALDLPILLSDIGGNQYFKKFDSQLEIMYFQPGNEDELEKRLIEFSLLPPQGANKIFYADHLSIEKMTNRYIDFYSKLL